MTPDLAHLPGLRRRHRCGCSGIMQRTKAWIAEIRMQTVYQVAVGGETGQITANLETAFRHVLHVLAPTPALRKDAEADDFASGLHAIGCAGSMFHRIRWMAEGRSGIEVTFTEHRLDAQPGFVSAMRAYDFETFDPSYAVQQALFRASESDEPTLEEIADDLLAQCTSGIRTGKLFGEDDAAFVARLLLWQDRLQGISVVPATGHPADILRRLPTVCADRFLDLSRQAFPDTAETPAP
jgi:hypothetical protein